MCILSGSLLQCLFIAYLQFTIYLLLFLYLFPHQTLHCMRVRLVWVLDHGHCQSLHPGLTVAGALFIGWLVGWMEGRRERRG